MSKRRVTLQEVARLSGVSTSAASVVLSGGSGTTRVSEDTARRIKKIADSMHYRPALAVRMLRESRTFTLGAVVPTTRYGYDKLWASMIRAAVARGYQTMITLAKLHTPDYAEQIEHLLQRGVDGLILFSTPELRASSIYRELKNGQRAVVFVEHDPQDKDFDFVGMDDVASYRLALDRLCSLGHQRIAFVYEQEGVVPQAHQRRLDFEQVIDEFGLPVLPRFYMQSPTTAEDEEVITSLKTMLDSPQPPTALVVRGHRRALRYYHTLQKIGRKIPQDFSVLNLTMQFYEGMRLQFDSIHSPVETIGETAINTLIDRSEGKLTAVRHQLLPGEYISGETIAPRR